MDIAAQPVIARGGAVGQDDEGQGIEQAQTDSHYGGQDALVGEGAQQECAGQHQQRTAQQGRRVTTGEGRQGGQIDHGTVAGRCGRRCPSGVRTA